jgi:23S rRNA U2552 (ribose-2'-O)-methylase RlmE/FtsJ
MEDLKNNFKIVKYYKPNASRTESSEIYIVASVKLNTI